jgi:hypothetical protein
MNLFGPHFWHVWLAVGIFLGASATAADAESISTGPATASHLTASAEGTGSFGMPLTVSQGDNAKSLNGLVVKNDLGSATGDRLGNLRCGDRLRPVGWHTRVTEHRAGATLQSSGVRLQI